VAGGCADWRCPPATNLFSGALPSHVPSRWPTLGDIATHYDVLGVRPDASAQAIRDSYRARARVHHPDRGSGTQGDDVTGPATATMAEINEAYRVLSDPGRRAVYDRSVRDVSAGRTVGTEPSVEADPDGPPVAHYNPLAPAGPARFPWKLAAVAALLGSGLVLASAAVSDSPADEVPDGIIRTDSCVAIEPNGDAREVACTGTNDIVVELLIPTDATCPASMTPHRDRLGLGIACVAE
jgi:molecular chaperone DnaJ